MIAASESSQGFGGNIVLVVSSGIAVIATSSAEGLLQPSEPTASKPTITSSIAFVLIFMSVAFLLVGVREDCVDVNRHIFRNMPQARVSFEVRNRHIFR